MAKKLTDTQVRHLKAAEWCWRNPHSEYGDCAEPAHLTWYHRNLFGKLTHSTFKALETRGLVESEDQIVSDKGYERTVYRITIAGRAALGAEPPAQAAKATTDEPLRKLYSDERLFLRHIVDADDKGRPLPRTDDEIDGSWGWFDSFRKDGLITVNDDGEVKATDLGHRTLAAAYTNEHFAYKYQPLTPAATPAPDRTALTTAEHGTIENIRKVSMSLYGGYPADQALKAAIYDVDLLLAIIDRLTSDGAR